MWSVLSILIIFARFWTLQSEEIASFYGSSYISLPLQEAYATNNIEFSFRTWLPDALFLLVAGRTDFCMVQLEAGLLKLRINLGAGEEEISSPPDIKFNDGEWHKVHIVRKEANLTMEVDHVHVVKKRLPGLFFELNIQFGIYIGGDGQFKEQFLGHMVGLRGCIADLMYAGTNLLQTARRRQGSTKVHGVTWNCASEFDVGSNTELNFVEDNAYVLLMHSIGRGGARWQFEIRTDRNNSLILYNTGSSSNSHLMAAEIFNGQLTVLLNAAVKKVQLVNKKFIADNKWHKIVIQYTAHLLETTVDTTMEMMKISSVKYLDLSDAYYIGGIELSQRSRALVNGVKTTDISFLGCIKGLSVNGESIGLTMAKSTLGIKPGKCVELNTTQSAIDQEILKVSQLQVNEGQTVQFSSNAIHMIVDYSRWNLRDSSVLFRVIKSDHGLILTTNGTVTDRFSLLDMNMGKIGYLHDGSDTIGDTIHIEMKLGDNLINSHLPRYLQGLFSFDVPVTITPMNDPPVISTGILKIAKGTKKIITPDILNATDPDSKPLEIIYTVVDVKKSKPKFEAAKIGKFEYLNQPKHPIYTFSQQDVDMGLVLFTLLENERNTHYDNFTTNDRILLNVTDGKSPVQTIVIKISLYDLELKLKHSKGLHLVHNTTALIQQKDLSFATNVADDYVINNIRIDIVEQPHYGKIECERDSRYWEVCDWFLTGEIGQKHVRYKHTNGSPKSDEFRFRASVNKVHTSTVYNFTINFVKLQLEQLHINNLYLNGTADYTVTIDNIEYQTIPILASNKNIKYHLSELPKYGSIVNATDNSKLHLNDIFTQAHIEKEQLKYVLNHRTYSTLSDSFSFMVSAKNCEDLVGHLRITYVPSEDLKKEVQITLAPIQIIEGEKANIGVSHLNIETKSFDYLIYNVSNLPSHGYLQICSDKNCTFISNKCTSHGYECINTTEFTSDDIKRGYVYYNHDDSETRHDHFEFTAWSIKYNFQYVGEFSANVILKNDNPPKRVIDKVFQVVLEQTKILTSKDLKYVDSDINTTPNDIVYTCQSISNGALYNVARPTDKITTFSQSDLDNNVILFKHHGDEYGKIALWITDGQFYENGNLEIFASKPFVKIVSGNIIVKQGSNSVIDRTMLNVETNLNVGTKNIIYRILKNPRNGNIKFIFNNDNVKQFTQDDINGGRIVYVHNISSPNYDQFVVRVNCQETTAESQMHVKILPSIYWQPLVILSTNKPLSVEESTSATISRSFLEILHPEIPPNEIVYHVILKPKFGSIQLKTSNNPQHSVQTFDQGMINSGHLHYIQNVANQTQDSIVFDVTNGILWLRNIVLNIAIIPEHFYITTDTLNVTEGTSVLITKESLRIVTDYYKNKIFEYSLLRLPKHGFLQIGNSREHIRKFSERDLSKELLKYVHDSSENFEDSFVIVGHAGLKESEPAMVKIKINPVNDQTPLLVNNSGLQMWEGGCAMISTTLLGSIDLDIPKDPIIYKITGNWWGNLVLKDSTVPLQSFTQQQLEKGLVYFNHTNGTMAKFTFRLTDNVHTSKEHIFIIETKPVMLSLPINKGLHVFPLNRQKITNSSLLAKASDLTREVIFKITKAPSLGRFVLKTIQGSFYAIDQFTQRQINNEYIFYEHIHPFDGLYANDSINFDVESRLTPRLSNQKFEIDISVSSGELHTYIPVVPLTVDEGGLAIVQLNMSQVVSFLENHANLHAPIIHATAWPPKYGSIFVDSNLNLTTFTQSQFDNNLVKYQHDHSDTLNDTLQFTLYLIPDYITLCNIEIPVHINPINDQPFKLITQAPSMSVVYGENVTITRKLLLTEDPDTPPDLLEYDIINEPTEGKIVFASNLLPVAKFTQKDIDEERIVYKHSGSNSTVAFYFRVWDGKFKPVYTIFNIQIVPINIILTSGSPIYIQQGLNVATVTAQHIQVKANVDVARVSYNISTIPAHGTIYVQDTPQLSFSHDDLISGRVMYMQTDMTTANDTFRVSACVQSTAVSNFVQVLMMVQPLMQKNNFTALIGKHNKIGLSVLDATPLAELTSSNPVYSVIRKPIFGTLNKIIRSSGDRKIVYDQEVDSFTHEELRSGLIYYVAGSDESLNGIEDLLIFILSTSIFQPAYGELRFRIVSDRIEPELKRHRGGMHIASPNISSDYVPIVVMVLGVLLLGVSVIVIIKCRSVDMIKEEPRMLDGCQQPIPLPRPPDHLMASSPHLKRYISEEIALPTHISLPHCKVTPLGPVESSLASSELDVHSKYPYGSAEDGTVIEDWCSNQETSSDTNNQATSNASNSGNPLLRRNQYWV